MENMENTHGEHEDHHEQGPDKVRTVIVNGRERQVDTKELSYEQVVALAFDDAFSNPNRTYVVTYRRGEGDKPQGTLAKGGSVKVKEGMIFNVSPSDKS